MDTRSIDPTDSNQKTPECPANEAGAIIIQPFGTASKSPIDMFVEATHRLLVTQAILEFTIPLADNLFQGSENDAAALIYEASERVEAIVDECRRAVDFLVAEDAKRRAAP